MKKKEMKRLIRELQEQNTELRFTRYRLISDVRALLGKDPIEKAYVEMKHNYNDDIEGMMFKGEAGINDDGFICKIENVNNDLIDEIAENLQKHEL